MYLHAHSFYLFKDKEADSNWHKNSEDKADED